MLVMTGTAFADRLHESIHGPDESATVWNLDGAMIAGGGDVLPGIEIGLSTRILDSSPLYLGGELGMFLSADRPSYFMMPILASLYYQFEPYSSVHPLLGVLTGPNISTGGGYSTVSFEFLFRPGINIALGRVSLNLEPRFGVIGDNFVFAPQVGAVLAL
jgi:hypothetical protein